MADNILRRNRHQNMMGILDHESWHAGENGRHSPRHKRLSGVGGTVHSSFSFEKRFYPPFWLAVDT